MAAGRRAGKTSAGKKTSGKKARPGKPVAPPKAPARASAKAAARAPARTAKPRAKAGAARAPARPARAARRGRPLAAPVDASLFEPLTEGERADALRILTEERRLASMAKVARYRVIAVEPLVLKPPHLLSARRLARVVAYDYSGLRSVDALIDLDLGEVAHLQVTDSQPALAREEEVAAVAVALGDDRVKRELGLGDEPQAALHYWSRRGTDVAHARRSAAVLFGQPDARPSLVAVVDLVDAQVTEVVAADQW
jgi:hypothetical protein